MLSLRLKLDNPKNKIKIIKELRIATGFGLRETKRLVEGTETIPLASIRATVWAYLVAHWDITLFIEGADMPTDPHEAKIFMEVLWHRECANALYKELYALRAK